MSNYNFLKNAKADKSKILQSDADLALQNNDMAKEIATGNTSSVNKINSASDLKLSNYSDYTSDNNLTKLNNKRLDAINQIENSQYNSSYQDLIDNTLNEIVNGKTYSYNANEDPLYQQYEELYRKNASMAAEDAQGTAASLTGGYGNTYAEIAGQQTYQNYMDQLNEVALDLENQAYNRHQNDLTNDYNTLNALQNLDSSDYNRYVNDLSKSEYLSDAYGSLFANAENSKNYQDETKYNHKQDGIDNYFKQLSYDLAKKEFELNAEDVRHDNALATRSYEDSLQAAIDAMSNGTAGTESEIHKIGDSVDYNDVSKWVSQYNSTYDSYNKMLVATYLERAVESGAITPEEADSIVGKNNIDLSGIVTRNNLIDLGVSEENIMTEKEFGEYQKSVNAAGGMAGAGDYENYLREIYDELVN